MMCRTIVAVLAVSLLLAISVRAADEAPAAKATSTLVMPAQKATIPEVKHFITKWLLLGPFAFGENEFGGYPQTASVDKEFMPKEADLDGTQAAPKGAKWQAKSFNDTDSPGKVDLGEAEHIAMYAVAWVECPEAIKDAKLMVGCDDFAKIWINGKLVYTYKTECRAGEADQETVKDIALNKGTNHVVVKVTNILGAYDFFVRFTDKNGYPYSVKAEAKAAKK
jgi:hypothetical protein